MQPMRRLALQMSKSDMAKKILLVAHDTLEPGTKRHFDEEMTTSPLATGAPSTRWGLRSPRLVRTHLHEEEEEEEFEPN